MENEEADALTNSDFRHFSSEHRVDVDMERLPFGVLPRLLETGEAFIKELNDMKAAKALSCEAAGRKRRKIKGESLRETNPW